MSDLKFRLLGIPIVNAVGLFLTVIALVFSLIQSYESTQITKAISTSYVGEFPSSMSEINKLLEEADRDILIFTDVLPYGIYSNPSEFHKYLTTIEKKAVDLENKRQAEDSINVRIIIYNKFLLKRQRSMQHVGADSMNNYMRLRNYKGFKDFLLTYDPKTVSMDSFYKIQDSFSLFHEQADALRNKIFREKIKKDNSKLINLLSYDFSKAREDKNNYKQFNAITDEYKSKILKRGTNEIDFEKITYDGFNCFLNKLSVAVEHV